MRLLIFTQAVDQNDPILGFFHRWIEVFADHCEAVTVICLRKGDYKLPRHVRVLSLGKEQGGSRLKYLVRFYQYLWQERGAYDAVFIHMNQIYAILGGWLWKWGRIPVGLWYCHKHTPLSLKMAIPFIEALFTQMHESTTVKTNKKRVVGHGIDTNLFSDVSATNKEPKTCLQFAMIGRVTAVKNLDTFIEALNLVKERLPPFKLLVIGEPITNLDLAYATSLKERIQKYTLTNNIVFVGSKSRTELKYLLSQTDLVINLTKTDSFDKALLESWAMGIPVLAANASAKQVLESLKLPLCFSVPADDPTRVGKELVDCIEVLENIEERERLREALSAYVRQEHNLIVLIPRILAGLQRGA